MSEPQIKIKHSTISHHQVGYNLKVKSGKYQVLARMSRNLKLLMCLVRRSNDKVLVEQNSVVLQIFNHTVKIQVS